MISVADGVATVEVRSDAYARFVRLHTSLVTAPFSDNFFDLLPGESRRVTIPVGDITAEAFAASLSVRHLAQVKKGESRLAQNLKRLAIFLIPINFGSYIYYRFLI